MTLLVETGTFTKETSNVDGTDQTVTLVDSTLTPKVLWLWATSNTSNATFADDLVFSYGFSDGTDDACVACIAEDGIPSSDTSGVIRNDSCICIQDANTPNTTSARASVVSFGAGQFVLDWAVSDAVGIIIHYMVAGGTDITNVKVLNTTVATTAIGDQGYTGVGFQGDFINTIIGHHAQTINTPTGNAVVWQCNIGFATSSSDEFAWGGHSEDGSGSSEASHLVKPGSIIFSSEAGSADDLLMAASFVSFGADGFTFNYSNGPDASTQVFSALVIKGGLWNVGTGAVPSPTGNQTITTTSGRDPEGVMMFTWGTTTTDTADTFAAHMRFCIGAADNALHENCISTHDTASAGTMVTTMFSSVTKIIHAHTANATASSSTTLAEADIVDMDNDGNFIINWTTTLNGMRYAWFAVSKVFGGEPPAAPTDIRRPLVINVTDVLNVQWSKNIRPTIRVFGARVKDLIENFTRRYLRKWVSFSNPILARLVDKSSTLHQDSTQLIRL